LQDYEKPPCHGILHRQGVRKENAVLLRGRQRSTISRGNSSFVLGENLLCKGLEERFSCP
jgi:hypothetical protein